jgi:two-component system cell cycle response regulator
MTARILVVDDAELNTMLLEAKLSSEYYEVIAADNGPAALELAESELPDIILLDVMMPRMDGFEVCRRLKANPRTTDIPVVMVTALSDVADRLRGLESGADEFLTKPVNDTELFARVRSLVRLKRMMEELRFREQVCRRFGNAEYAAEMAEDVRGARILLLEADQTTMLQIPNAVAPLTAAVLRATSCAAAQTLIDPSIEVVIASLSMPDGDPLRLVSQWRASEATRQLPIVLLGEKRELPRLAKGLELGANDYLVRPIDRNELLARVRTQIRRKRLQDRLGENYRRSLAQALTDELTGVYNRRYVFAHMNELIVRMSESGTTTAVITFDIDHFKRVNDRYGHPTGDNVLRELAGRALRNVRSVDLVGRLGGEEFVVVMPETSLPDALVAAERLRGVMADQPFTMAPTGERVPITISIGVAIITPGDDTLKALLKRADDALYTAKNAGRNRVVSAPMRHP